MATLKKHRILILGVSGFLGGVIYRELHPYFQTFGTYKTSKSILEKNIGGYLDRLENEYSIIKKIKPMFAKEGSRSVKYEIIDNFFNFWFRFIYKNKSAIEIENYEYVKEIIKRDFST